MLTLGRGMRKMRAGKPMLTDYSEGEEEGGRRKSKRKKEEKKQNGVLVYRTSQLYCNRKEVRSEIVYKRFSVSSASPAKSECSSTLRETTTYICSL